MVIIQSFLCYRLIFCVVKIHYWFLEYDILNILGKRSVQNMAVLWNPEEDSNDREESTENQRKNSWDYLYNIEIWHERCLKH
jgi:hypothetical protein